MHWASWEEFWRMGGSGPFVWGAYGLAVVTLACEVAMIRARARRARARVRVAAASKEPS
jgi:heme exporter protein D